MTHGDDDESHNKKKLIIKTFNSIKQGIGGYGSRDDVLSSVQSALKLSWIQMLCTICPNLCFAPIKYQYANYTNPNYKVTGEASLKLQLINQRSDFAFALFTGGLSTPALVAVSNTVAFENPNAPVL
ncbi:probable inactive purple acid phosphatase 1 [Helianthus annuus]|uniref:probable inactive purple acid phosphatase 1 n=1 Tax=Helianthus annuus TaxID=4232 RepID=UPI0016531917|nr:probable inactive purple acid phosphatase 1 [Helianthus annuus]